MPDEKQRKFSFKQLWLYCYGTVIRPTATFDQLAQQASLGYSFLVMMVWGILYGLFAYILYLGGNKPVALWVAIPEASFYLWEAIYLMPLVLLLWILFSAIAHLLVRLQGYEGEFESVLAVMGFAWAVPFTLLFLIPDIVLSAVFGTEVMEALVPIYGPVSFVWVLLLAGVGLRIVYRVRFFRGIMTVIVSFVLHAPLGILLIR